MENDSINGKKSSTKSEETFEEAEKLVLNLLNTLNRKHGNCINSEVLENTPGRFARAFGELTKGYSINPKEIIESALFDIDKEYNDLIIVDDISFNSTCEHHLFPFSGKVAIGYIPNDKVLGLSKFARIVEAFSQRLSLQERLTTEIAEAIQEYVKPKGVIVYITSDHTCMTNRGVKNVTSNTKSIYTTGEMKNNSILKSEFLQLINKK